MLISAALLTSGAGAISVLLEIATEERGSFSDDMVFGGVQALVFLILTAALFFWNVASNRVPITLAISGIILGVVVFEAYGLGWLYAALPVWDRLTMSMGSDEGEWLIVRAIEGLVAGAAAVVMASIVRVVIEDRRISALHG